MLQQPDLTAIDSTLHTILRRPTALDEIAKAIHQDDRLLATLRQSTDAWLAWRRPTCDAQAPLAPPPMIVVHRVQAGLRDVLRLLYPPERPRTDVFALEEGDILPESMTPDTYLAYAFYGHLVSHPTLVWTLSELRFFYDCTVPQAAEHCRVSTIMTRRRTSESLAVLTATWIDMFALRNAALLYPTS